MIVFYLLLIAPKLLFDYFVRGKKHPGLMQRLGYRLPKSFKPLIWLHAVSVGEIKASQPLFRALKEHYPNDFFLITTTTATGQEEAKRSLPEADAFSYLPIDLKSSVRRWIQHFHPHLFILVESDFWPNLLTELKKSGCTNILVSGKMSARSAKRFQFFSSFTKKLFSRFDLICVQNEEYYQRFLPLVPDPPKLRITGNLKLDIAPQMVDLSPFGFSPEFLTISCTHAPEEEEILEVLKGIESPIFLAPRHPHRFEEVAQLLAKKQIPFSRWSEKKRTPVILVDAMGQLPICYSLSRLAIVCGSYAPIGGHNLLEPCLYGVPVLFGPHVFLQKELATRLLDAKAGIQVPIEKLRETVVAFLNDPQREHEMREAARRLIDQSRGSLPRTLDVLLATF